MKHTGHGLVVTGVGSISAGGNDTALLWKHCLMGRVNVTTQHLAGLSREMTVYAAPHHTALTAREQRLGRRADRSARLALAAASQAWAAAGLQQGGLDRTRLGVIVGSSRGPAEVNAVVGLRGAKYPTDSANTTFASISGLISSALNLDGVSLMTSATCISGAMALKSGMQFIQSGELDVVLVGGVDAPLLASLLEQFAVTGVGSPENGPMALRPFDRHRSGTVLGEGAAFVVLESEASARRRGAVIYGRVHAVAVGCDSVYRTGSDQEGAGLRRVTEDCLRGLQLKTSQVDLLHLHGTGTELNDAMESRCVRRVFGPEAEQPWSWASKGITGHTLGASALFQVVLALEAMRQAFVPPTVNCVKQDPACAIRLSRGVETRMETALCLTSGFWGNRSCIALGCGD